MDSSLADLLNKPIELDFEGKKYKFSKITLSNIAEFENYLRSQAIKAYRESCGSEGEIQQCSVCKGIGLIENKRCQPCNGTGSINIYVEMLAKLSKMSLTPGEVLEKMYSIDGVKYLMWLSLKENQKELTLNNMDALIRNDNIEKVYSLFNIIQGLPEVDLSKKEEDEKKV